MNYAITLVIGLVVGLAGGVVAGVMFSRPSSQTDFESLQVQIEQYRSRIAQVDKLVAELRRRQAETEAQLNQAQQAIRQPDPEKELLRQQAEQARDEHAQAQRRVLQLEQELEQSRQQTTPLQTQMAALRARLLDLEDDIVQARQRAAQAEANAQQTLEEALAAQTEQSQAQSDKDAERRSQLESSLVQAQAEARLAQTQVANLSQQYPLKIDAALRASQLQSDLAQAQQERESAVMEAALCKDKAGQLELDLAAARQRISELEDQHIKLQERIDNMETRWTHDKTSSLPFGLPPEPESEPDLIEPEAIEPEPIDYEPIEILEVPDELPEPWPGQATRPVSEELASGLFEEIPLPSGQEDWIEGAPALESIELIEETSAAEAQIEEEVLSAVELPPASIEQAEQVAPAEEILAYCVKCKTKRPMLHPYQVMMANERMALKDSCPECGTTLFRFIKG